jgi:hypothetical protein
LVDILESLQVNQPHGQLALTSIGAAHVLRHAL